MIIISVADSVALIIFYVTEKSNRLFYNLLYIQKIILTFALLKIWANMYI